MVCLVLKKTFMAIIYRILSVAMTSILYVLKLLVALLQAYIFTLLSAVFIGMAAEEHEHDHEHDEHIHAEQSV